MMMTFALVRQRLAACWLILAILLAVTLLADFVADRLGVNALLGGPARVPFDATRTLDLVQCAIILLALVFGLLGWNSGLRRLSIIAIGLVTLGLVIRVVALIVIFQRQSQENAFVLLGDGCMLWLKNLLVFAAWYWLIDTGGQFRAAPPDGGRRHLLFPQQAAGLSEWQDWQPDPLDYLFVAFNTSMAFSPTDTLFLTRPAKLLMMCQALTSLMILTVILSRAINSIQ